MEFCKQISKNREKTNFIAKKNYHRQSCNTVSRMKMKKALMAAYEICLFAFFPFQNYVHSPVTKL